MNCPSKAQTHTQMLRRPVDSSPRRNTKKGLRQDGREAHAVPGRSVLSVVQGKKRKAGEAE